MTVKNSFLCLGLLGLSISNLLAQENGRFHRLLLENGLNIQPTLEQRFTTNALNDWGFQTRTGYEFGKGKQLNRLEIHFAKNFTDKTSLSRFINLNSGLRYIHLRSTKRTPLMVGGYMDIGSTLIFSPSSSYENNPISYTIWSSIGVTFNWQKTIAFKQKKGIISVESAFPLVGYVIRPAHAHPYPENYLEDGIFDFDRKEMGKYLIKSGKLMTLNQFNYFKTKTTLSIPFGKKAHQLGLSYNWELLWEGGEQKIWQAQHQLSVYLKINFK